MLTVLSLVLVVDVVRVLRCFVVNDIKRVWQI